MKNARLMKMSDYQNALEELDNTLFYCGWKFPSQGDYLASLKDQLDKLEGYSEFEDKISEAIENLIIKYFFLRSPEDIKLLLDHISPETKTKLFWNLSEYMARVRFRTKWDYHCTHPIRHIEKFFSHMEEEKCLNEDYFGGVESLSNVIVVYHYYLGKKYSVRDSKSILEQFEDKLPSIKRLLELLTRGSQPITDELIKTMRRMYYYRHYYDLESYEWQVEKHIIAFCCVYAFLFLVGIPLLFAPGINVCILYFTLMGLSLSPVLELPAYLSYVAIHAICSHFKATNIAESKLKKDVEILKSEKGKVSEETVHTASSLFNNRTNVVQENGTEKLSDSAVQTAGKRSLGARNQ